MTKQEKPGGLAHGKTRIFQVNLPRDGAHAIFEYCTEHGEGGVAHLRLGTETGGLELDCWLPGDALTAFVDHFRDVVAGRFPLRAGCGEDE